MVGQDKRISEVEQNVIRNGYFDIVVSNWIVVVIYSLSNTGYS